jgi:hypothetical protein
MLFLAVASAAAQTPLSCNALISANNQLYLVARDGTLLSQFITDGLPKTSITLSPDGTKAAYLSSSNPNSFTVVSSSGRSATTVIPASAQATLSAVSWDASSVLKVRSHIARENDLFQFYAVPDSFSSTLQRIGNEVIGRVCAAKWTDDFTPACITEDQIVVNKKVLAISDPSSADNSTLLGTVSVMLRSSVATQTSPSFEIGVSSLSSGVTLQITLPNGNWKQSRVSVGENIPISWDDADYGFIPVSVDSTKGVVTVNIVKSKGAAGFDPAITWSSNNYVAAIERGKTGAQLVLVKSSGNEAPHRIALDLAEPVVSLNYDTPTTLVLRLRSYFGAMPVSFVNGSTASIKAGLITPLPTSLEVVLPNGKVKASVEGWSCR